MRQRPAVPLRQKKALFCLCLAMLRQKKAFGHELIFCQLSQCKTGYGNFCMCKSKLNKNMLRAKKTIPSEICRRYQLAHITLLHSKYLSKSQGHLVIFVELTRFLCHLRK